MLEWPRANRGTPNCIPGECITSNRSKMDLVQANREAAIDVAQTGQGPYDTQRPITTLPENTGDLYLLLIHNVFFY